MQGRIGEQSEQCANFRAYLQLLPGNDHVFKCRFRRICHECFGDGLQRCVGQKQSFNVLFSDEAGQSDQVLTQVFVHHYGGTTIAPGAKKLLKVDVEAERRKLQRPGR